MIYHSDPYGAKFTDETQFPRKMKHKSWEI